MNDTCFLLTDVSDIYGSIYLPELADHATILKVACTRYIQVYHICMELYTPRTTLQGFTGHINYSPSQVHLGILTVRCATVIGTRY